MNLIDRKSTSVGELSFDSCKREAVFLITARELFDKQVHLFHVQ